MKHLNISTLLCLFLFSPSLFAQTQNISFQGTAISSFGQVIPSQSITVRLSIFTDIASGTAAYVETQTATTTATGAFSVQVGSGTAVTGTYSSINLMNGIHYLQVEIKPSSGTYSTISKGPIAQSVTVGWQCGNPLNVNHVAGAVAPVSKNVTYGTVTNIPGEPTKCWITSNLGADHQATSVDDATEASAGWCWQFNLKPGYKHDGLTLTPAWSINSINDNSDWLTTNDPCSIELGSGWRVPTLTEWSNVDANGSWTTWTDPWNSGLKLHVAGYLSYFDGSLMYRGYAGALWSSSQFNASIGSYMFFQNGVSATYSNGDKAFALSLRCIKD